MEFLGVKLSPHMLRIYSGEACFEKYVGLLRK
jgi:hypothetical protein